MSILAKAVRGGLVEQLAGASRSMVLRNAEIERFEDEHVGIFDLWDGFYDRAAKPTNRQVRDLLALGLVGGGLDDLAADAVISGLGPEHNLHLYKVASALIGVAFLPDAFKDAGDDLGADPDDDDDDAGGAADDVKK